MNVTDSTDSDERRLTRLEYAMWGPRGQNGVVGYIKEIDRKLTAYINAEEKRRREEEEEDKGDRRFKLMAGLAIFTAMVGPVIGFALGQVS